MAKLKDVAAFLDERLNIAKFRSDASNNGLQFEGGQDVFKAVFAVDASHALFTTAADLDADFIFVHHGISWGGSLKRILSLDAKRVAMLAANSIWGLMSPIAKLVMLGGIVTPLVVTDLRVFGAMILFWILSFFRKPEHVDHKDMAKLFVASLLAIVFNQGCFIFGVGLTSPGDASIITTRLLFVNTVEALSTISGKAMKSPLMTKDQRLKSVNAYSSFTNQRSLTLLNTILII